MTTRNCTCGQSIEPTFIYCNNCGARQEGAERPVLSLDEVLDRRQLHFGHDYRRRDQDASGATTAVYMLGASESVIRGMRVLLPGYDFIERKRRPGVGDPADWLRVDIVPKTSTKELSAAEHQALRWFAWENGQHWKQALRDEWMRACARVPMEIHGGRLPVRQLLQQLHNDADRFGPAGLVAYRLPAGFAFKAQDANLDLYAVPKRETP